MSRTPAELLDLPVERSARWLALRFLEEAAAAHARMEEGADPEALHDFRVGLRRLRSTVRAYRRWLGGSLTGKDRRRLKALADATGGARDAEVQIAWLEAHRARLPGDARPGADHMWEVLRLDQRDAERRLEHEVAKDFPRERWRLSRRLRFFRVEVELDDPAGGPLLAAVLGRLTRELTDELERHLARVRSVEDQEEAHEARIAAKRLRYLVEPFADEVEARDLLKRMKKLQDALGDMHDVDALLARVNDQVTRQGGDTEEAEAARAPLVALAAALEKEREALFGEVETRWLGGAAGGFFAEVRELSRRVSTAGRPDREIERKFLLKRMPRLDGLEVQVLEIDQGWLPGDRLAERLRRTRSGGTVKYFRTVKLGAGTTRLELEEETTEAVFRKLWSLTRGKRVRKLRYKVPDGDFTWEIDRFRGRRLVLAEVELPDEEIQVVPPVWLRRLVVRDVTGEPEYVNINLAR